MSSSRILRIARSIYADSFNREQLFQDYLKLISFDGQREIAPGYIEKLRKQFMETPFSELWQKIDQDKKDIAYERQRWDTLNTMRVQQEERDKVNLRTPTEDYNRTDNVFERVICSDKNPMCEKKGMRAYGDEISSNNRELEGYYGVHVGDARAWLPILMRDEYCQGKRAYFYEIDTSSTYHSNTPFYVMEDFHPTDKTDLPDSEILFSKYPVIPAHLITLTKSILVSKIRPARELDHYDTRGFGD
jgi:hypothetical protein